MEESVRTLQSESSSVSMLLADVNTRLGELVESDSLFQSDTLNRFNLMEKTVSSMQDEFASCTSLNDLRSLVDSFRESTLDTLRELPSQHAEVSFYAITPPLFFIFSTIMVLHGIFVPVCCLRFHFVIRVEFVSDFFQSFS